MKSSFHNLIPFLPSLLNHSTAISRDSLNSSDNSSAPKLLSWQADVWKFNCLKRSLCPSYNPSSRTAQKTQCLYCRGVVFTAPWHSNGGGVDHTENTALPLLPECLLSCSIATAVRVTSHIVTIPRWEPLTNQVLANHSLETARCLATARLSGFHGDTSIR
jgi:hypothetical protein